MSLIKLFPLDIDSCTNSEDIYLYHGNLKFDVG